MTAKLYSPSRFSLYSTVLPTVVTMKEKETANRSVGVQLFVTPGAVAFLAQLSMGFSRQEYWSGLPFPSPGDLLNPGIEPRFPALQADSLPSEPPGEPYLIYIPISNSFISTMSMFLLSILRHGYLVYSPISFPGIWVPVLGYSSFNTLCHH